MSHCLVISSFQACSAIFGHSDRGRVLFAYVQDEKDRRDFVRLLQRAGAKQHEKKGLFVV